jgi:hypothetical protein
MEQENKVAMDKSYLEMVDEYVGELASLLIMLLKVRSVTALRHEQAGAQEMEEYAQAIVLQALANIAYKYLPENLAPFVAQHLPRIEAQLDQSIDDMENAAVFFAEKAKTKVDH